METIANTTSNALYQFEYIKSAIGAGAATIIAILLLGKYAFIALDDYTQQKKQGIKDPVFKASILPKQDGIYWWKDDNK